MSRRRFLSFRSLRCVLPPLERSDDDAGTTQYLLTVCERDSALPTRSRRRWLYVSEKLPIRPRRAFCTGDRSAVRPRHAGDSWFDRARSALSNQLSATSWLPHHEPREVHNHQHSGIHHVSARRAKRRWSDSSLQVEDPKASGTPTSLASIHATFTGSETTMDAHSIIVCAL